MKQPGNIYKRGRCSYRITYSVDGVPQQETVKGPTPELAYEEAKRILQIRVGDLAAGKPVASRPNTITLNELADDHMANQKANNQRSTWRNIDTRLKLHILPVFGDWCAATIKNRDLNDYVTLRRNEGAADGQIALEMQDVKQCFRLGMLNNRIYLMPKIPKLEAKVREGFFEYDQLVELCRYLPDHLVKPCCFAYITGWRHEEVMSRRVRHVVANGVRMEGSETKNGKPRMFPMVETLRRLLALIPALRGRDQNALLFPTPDGDQIGRFDKAWSTACKKAGLQTHTVPRMKMVDPKKPELGLEPVLYKYNFGRHKKGEPKTIEKADALFHDFRRTAYRNLVWAYVPENQACFAVGWLDRATADRYCVVSPNDLDVVRQRFEAGYPMLDGIFGAVPALKEAPVGNARTGNIANFIANCTISGATD